MSTFTEYQNTTFVTEQCCSCGVRFAMEKNTYDFRKIDGKGFFCTNGHEQYYTDNDRSKLAKANEEMSRLRTNLQLERDQRAAAEKRLDSLKNRVSKGMCPCCHRTVKQLERHMATKHPGYVE